MRLALVLAMAATPALAGAWFLHDYGEARALFGDWMAVCDDGGEGDCRAVQSVREPGSDAFFDARLSLLLDEDGGTWTIELMDRGLVNTAVTGLAAEIDGAEVPIVAGDWTPSRGPNDNAIDALYITDPALTARLVEMMRPGARVALRYAPALEGDGVAAFSLRGVTAALEAVRDQVGARR